MSSIVTKAFYTRLKPGKNQSELTKLGKVISWVIMAFSVYLAIVLPQTIWRLLEIKLELLIQISPAIFIGLYNSKVKGKSIFYGMLVGTIFSLVVMVANKLGLSVPAKPMGIHAGVWGLLINCWAIYFFEKRRNKKNK